MPSGKCALVLGVCGQDGAYLAQLLIGKGYVVHGSSRTVATERLHNLQALGIAGQVRMHVTSLEQRDEVRDLLAAVQPDEVYMLSGQSSVGRSFEAPRETFLSIAVSTLNVLETLREMKSGTRAFCPASTDMYGNCDTPATEQTPFRPTSPYSMSKGAAFEIAKSYRETLGVFVATGILSSHDSPFRPPQFVTSKIIHGIKRIVGGNREKLKLANLDIERDWGWAPDYVEAYWRMLQIDEPSDFIVATGETNSLRSYVETAFSCVGLNWQEHVQLDQSLSRLSDFRRTWVNPAKAKLKLGWVAKHRMRDVVRLLQA